MKGRPLSETEREREDAAQDAFSDEDNDAEGLGAPETFSREEECDIHQSDCVTPLCSPASVRSVGSKYQNRLTAAPVQRSFPSTSRGPIPPKTNRKRMISREAFVATGKHGRHVSGHVPEAAVLWAAGWRHSPPLRLPPTVVAVTRRRRRPRPESTWLSQR